jgi:hypothetical protein
VSKFFAALFLPEDYEKQLATQHKATLQNFRSIHFSPFDRASDRRSPKEPIMLDLETVFDSPNFVYSATAKGVCLAAILKANELYPGQVPASPAQLADAAAAQYGYETTNCEERLETWAELGPLLAPGQQFADKYPTTRN